MQHTPAPWIVTADDQFPRGTHPYHESRFVTDAANPQGWIAKLSDHPNQAANARLIAAAPDLLDLVRQAYDRFTDNDYQPANHALAQWLKTADAAIEKATT